MVGVEDARGVGESGSTESDVVGKLLSDDDSGSNKTEQQGDDLAKKIDNLAKAVDGLQRLDGRRGNDIGHLKKMLENMATNSQPSMDGQGSDSDLLGQLLSNPDETLESLVEKVSQKKTMQKKQFQSSTKEAIKQVAEDFDDYFDDVVAAVAKDVGASKEDIRESIFEGGPGIPINVYHRVKAERRVKELESLVNALKNKGVDISGAKAFSRGSSNGESLDTPDDPLANVDFRSLPKDQVQKLYQKTIASKRR